MCISYPQNPHLVVDKVDKTHLHTRKANIHAIFAILLFPLKMWTKSWQPLRYKQVYQQILFPSIFRQFLAYFFNQFMEILLLTRNECSCMMLLNGRCIKNPKKRNQKNKYSCMMLLSPKTYRYYNYYLSSNHYKWILLSL